MNDKSFLVTKKQNFTNIVTAEFSIKLIYESDIEKKERDIRTLQRDYKAIEADVKKQISRNQTIERKHG